MGALGWEGAGGADGIGCAGNGQFRAWVAANVLLMLGMVTGCAVGVEGWRLEGLG